MATEDLECSYTGSSVGIDWSLTTGSSLRTVLATDNDNVALQHQCNKGTDYSSIFAIDNWSAAFSSITSVQVCYRVRRTGTTDNATQRVEIDRTGAGDWWLGGLTNAVNTFYTETVTAPSGGWNDTKIDAARLRYYHFKGTDTSTAYLRQDYFRLRINYVEPVAGFSLLSYVLPYAACGALPFLQDLAMFLREAKVKTMYSPKELRQIKERIKNPTYFDMGGIECLS